MFYASTQQAEKLKSRSVNNHEHFAMTIITIKNWLDDFKPVQTDLSQKVRYVSVAPYPSLQQPDSSDQWLMALMDERHLIRHEL